MAFVPVDEFSHSPAVMKPPDLPRIARPFRDALADREAGPRARLVKVVVNRFADASITFRLWDSSMSATSRTGPAA